MAEITDAVMDARLETARPYIVVLLRKGPAYLPPGDRPAEQAKIVREHGRRNMRLQAEGKLAIVGPLTGAGDLVGFYIFAVGEAEARDIMDTDVAVSAEIFVYETATFHGFPGDTLPGI